MSHTPCELELRIAKREWVKVVWKIIHTAKKPAEKTHPTVIKANKNSKVKKRVECVPEWSSRVLCSIQEDPRVFLRCTWPFPPQLSGCCFFSSVGYFRIHLRLELGRLNVVNLNVNGTRSHVCVSVVKVTSEAIVKSHGKNHTHTELTFCNIVTHPYFVAENHMWCDEPLHKWPENCEWKWAHVRVVIYGRDHSNTHTHTRTHTHTHTRTSCKRVHALLWTCRQFAPHCSEQQPLKQTHVRVVSAWITCIYGVITGAWMQTHVRACKKIVATFLKQNYSHTHNFESKRCLCNVKAVHKSIRSGAQEPMNNAGIVQGRMKDCWEKN